MLIWMREGAGGKAIKILLLSMMTMAVAGLVLMDVGGFFRSDINSGTIIKGAGVELSTMEFQRTVQRTVAAQGVEAQEAYRLGLIDQIVQGEIQSQLLSQKTHSLGLLVGDDDVKKQIHKLADSLSADGQNRKDAMQMFLRSRGITEGELVSSLREEMSLSLLRAALQPPASLTSPLIASSLYRYDHEKRSAQGIILKNASVTDITPPTEENLKKYYDANKQEFLIPETRTVTVAVLKPAMLQKNIKITDEQLKAEYEKNLASFTKKGARNVEQAIVKDESEANKVIEAVKGGKSLKDSTTPDTYISAKDYEPATILREVAADVFAADKGAVVGPIRSAAGWHVLVVNDIKGDEVTSFDTAKERLKEELEQIAGTDAMMDAGNTIEDRLASGDDLATIVSEYGLTTEIIGPFRRGGTSKDGKNLFTAFGPDGAKILEAAFDVDEGEVAPLVETADGQFQFVRVDQIIPDTYHDYASEKASLEKRWVADQKRLSNQARAKKALADLNAGKDLAAVSRKLDTAPQTFAGINRKSEPAAPLNPVVAAQIFTTEKGKAFSSEIDGGFIVGVVTDVTMPPASNASDKDLADLSDLVGRSLSQDIVSQFVGHLTDGKKIQVNRAQIDAMFAPQAQQTPLVQ